MRPADLPLLIFDGAFGTTMEERALPASMWGGYEGCNEFLNISAPEEVVRLHRSFFEAGAHVVETNTFGASRIVLEEYGLAHKVRAINMAAVANARAAMQGLPGVHFVAGSIGPGTKLPSLGHIGVEALADAVTEQAEALLEGGVDIFIIETCQDLLQLKTAMIAVFDVMEKARMIVPVMASVTMESTGSMLVGSDIAAVTATLQPFPLFSLGLNCATGPADMESHIRYLAENWEGRISCMPNQGLPEMVGGRTVYPMTPYEFVRHMRHFIECYGVTVVGGCCGTTSAHIKELVHSLADMEPDSNRGEVI